MSRALSVAGRLGGEQKKAMFLQGSADGRGDNFVAHFEAESAHGELQANRAPVADLVFDELR